MHNSWTEPFDGTDTKGTILLVKDNAFLCDLFRESLADAGYHVIAARDALEAIRLAECASDPIDLMLADSELPGVSGLELAARLSAERPQMRVIFMGSAGDKSTMGGRSGGPHRMLQTPFSLSHLIDAANRLLEPAECLPN